MSMDSPVAGRASGAVRWGRLAGFALLGALGGLLSGLLAFGEYRQPSMAEIDCPQGDVTLVDATVTATVVDDGLRAASTLRVRMAGVTPPWSTKASSDPGFGDQLRRCLLGLGPVGDLDRVDWADGTADFRFSTPSAPVPPVPADAARAYLRSGLVYWTDDGRFHIRVSVCDWDRPGLLCAGPELTKVTLSLPARYEEVAVTPPPHRVDVAARRTGGGTATIEWAFRGVRPPPVDVAVSLPWKDVAASYVTPASRTLSARVAEDSYVSVSLSQLVGLLGPLTVVLAAFLAFRRTPGRWPARGLAGALLLAGFLPQAVTVIHTDLRRPIVGNVLFPLGWAALTVLVLLLPSPVVAGRFRRPLARLAAGGAAVLLAGTMLAYALLGSAPAGPLFEWYYAVALVALTGIGVVVSARFVPPLFAFPATRPGYLPALRAAALYALVAFLGFAALFTLGQNIDSTVSLLGASDQAVLWSVSISQALSGALVPATTLLIGGLSMMVLQGAPESVRGRVVPPAAVLTVVVFTTAILLPAPSAAVFAGIVFPGWITVWLVLAVVVAWFAARVGEPASAGTPRPALLDQALRAASLDEELAEADRAVDGRQRRLRDYLELRERRRTDTPASRIDDFFRLGPGGSWFGNGCEAARIGSLLAIIPVSYYLWDAVQEVPSRLRFSTGLLVLLVAALLEVARWVWTSFAFGVLNGVLPGRSAAIKGIVFALMWLAGALLVQMVIGWSGGSTGQPWLYRFLQLFVFLTVLGLLFDLSAVTRAGGTWRRLRDIIGLRNYKEIVVALIPIALALVALVQQLVSGSGAEVAESIVDGIAAVVQGGSG
jgi:hypothetical protein